MRLTPRLALRRTIILWKNRAGRNRGDKPGHRRAEPIEPFQIVNLNDILHGTRGIYRPLPHCMDGSAGKRVA